MKYEEVFFRAYESVNAARAGIGGYVDRYKALRPQGAHGGQTADMVYFAPLQQLAAAA